MVLASTAIPLVAFKVGKDSLLSLLWIAGMLITTLWFIYTTFRIIFVIRDVRKALKAYCEALDLTREPFKITGVVKTAIKNPLKWLQAIKDAPGKYSLFSEDFSHF